MILTEGVLLFFTLFRDQIKVHYRFHSFFIGVTADTTVDFIGVTADATTDEFFVFYES